MHDELFFWIKPLLSLFLVVVMAIVSWLVVGRFIVMVGRRLIMGLIVMWFWVVCFVVLYIVNCTVAMFIRISISTVSIAVTLDFVASWIVEKQKVFKIKFAKFIYKD